MSLKQHLCLLLSVLLLSELPLAAGIPSKKSKYVGGTVTLIPKEVVGTLDTEDPTVLSFSWEKGGKGQAGKWQVPYNKVNSVAYGQHAGRRVGATIAWGVTTLGIMALPILFSKKRRHYLTIEFQDDQGQTQASIFEVGKDAVRVTLKTLEVRTGKKVEYEDEEARKSGNK